MQEQEVENKRLEHLLQTWVDYYSRGGDNGLGYPSMSPEARMRANGGIVSHADIVFTPQMNEEAEMIEDLVKQLAKENYDQADALRARYFARDMDFPVSNAAKKKRRDVVSKLAYQRHISNRTFQVRVKEAKKWLLGKIDKYSKKNSEYLLKKAA